MAPVNLQVQNALGLRDIGLSLSGITIVYGSNGAGKSALLDAIRATSGASKLLGETKKTAQVLVTHGAERGTIILTGSDGVMTVDLPSGEASSTGTPLSLSGIAQGYVVWSQLDTKGRARLLHSCAPVRPTIDDLRAVLMPSAIAVPEHERTSEIIAAREKFEVPFAKLWRDIEANGWDAELARAEGTRRDNKALWGNITGEQWGSAKAESWQPHDWDSDLNGVSIETLDARVVAAEAELEHAIGNAAVSDARRAELQSIVDRSSAGDDLTRLQEAVKKADEGIAFENEELARLPVPTGSNTGSCPHCSKAVLVTRDKNDGRVILRKSDTPPATKDEVTARMNAERAINDRINAIAERRKQYADAVKKRTDEIAEAKRAAEALASFPARSVSSDVDERRASVALAKAQRKAWQAKQQADKYHREILKNQRVVDALAPDGVRKSAMQRGLASVNAEIARFATSAKWPSIRILSDLAIEFDGRIGRLSRGERMICDITLQCVLTRMSGGNFVLIDDAEAIDATRRGGLVRAMHATGMSGVIAMTESKAGGVPPLPAQIGQTVRLENGTVAQ